ncbi:MAG: Phosphotransferase enzyme family protein [Mycobacterium sp.]|nr:Phosphotransferase enzyme family protein [Mycobacterium sp.]
MNLTAPTFDVPRFRDWLAGATGEPAEVVVSPIKGGASCEMFRVERLGQSWVVRRAPLASVSGTAHQVAREARIIQSLAGTAVPVPTVLAIAEDSSILGAPFFVMEHVDGVVVRRDGLPESLASQPQSHHALGEGLIDTLVALHAIDWTQTALAELSRPVGFLTRQVNRWMSQLAAYQSRELAGVDEVAAWLTANHPVHGELTVMHGDYKLDNLIWSAHPPPRVAGVVDFEMTTVGDPLIDLAWALIFWPEEDNLIALAPPGSPNGISADKCQSPAALAQRYAAATGRDLTGFDWYQAFSAWKLAIVLEGSFAKYRRGESTNPHHEVFGFVVDQLLLRARRFAR